MIKFFFVDYLYLKCHDKLNNNRLILKFCQEEMIKALKQFNAVFEEINKRGLSGSEQLILLHLTNIFNKARWMESVSISDETIRALINQYDANGKPATRA